MGVDGSRSGEFGGLGMADTARMAPGPATMALTLAGLAILGATGGAAAAVLTAGEPEVVIGDVSSDAPIAQAGLTTSATADPPSTGIARPHSPATSTAPISRDPLPSSSSRKPPGPAAPATPAAAPAPVRAVPAPAPMRQTYRSAPAPARTPATPPAAAPAAAAPPVPITPAITIPLLPVQPPPVVQPKRVTVG